MSKSLTLIFVIVFCLIALFIGFVGIAVLTAGPTNETEWSIGLLGIGSATLLFFGAFKTFQGQRQQARAELFESKRLMEQYAAKPKALVNVTNQVAEAEHSVDKSNPSEGPQIYARWVYNHDSWRVILAKLSDKTRKEEFYTAFWFPILFAIVFFAWWYVGALVGVVVGWLYIRFRVYFVQQKFALPPGQIDAEAIISDAYLRINGNFIHYADGKYFLKNLMREQDPKLGEYLHFIIGWVTSKGYPAEMDLYLPIPVGHTHEADLVLEAYKRARG